MCLPVVVSAQSNEQRAARAKVIAVVDFDCLTTNYPKDKLDKVVRVAMKQVEDKGVMAWGDRAFGYDLNGDKRPEYFIPLECGATGNCYWGVFALNPARLLGVLIAEYIYIRKRTSIWAAMTSYIHGSVSMGLVTTYALRNRKYVEVAGGYEVSAYRNDFPKFMGKVYSPCRK